MKECAICGEKVDDGALRCSKGHSRFRVPRKRRARDRYSSCLAQVVLLLFALSFGAGAIVIWYTAPVTTLTCRWYEANLADCQLCDRMLGVVPVRKTSIDLLEKAAVRQVTTVSEHEDGRQETAPDYSVILVHASGQEIKFSHYSSQRAAAERASKRINDYLATPTDRRLAVRHIPWIALLGGLAMMAGLLGLLYVWLNAVGLRSIADQVARLRHRLSRTAKRD